MPEALVNKGVFDFCYNKNNLLKINKGEHPAEKAPEFFSGAFLILFVC